MADETRKAATIDEYIAGFPPQVRRILRRIRATIAAVAPGARELISYRMPAFAQEGILLYFAAFKTHIGVYPPVSGDARLAKALSPYLGPKGNLKFPLDQPIPYDLITRIVALRVKQNLAKTVAARRRRQVAPETPRNKPRRPAAPAARRRRG